MYIFNLKIDHKVQLYFHFP